MGMGIALLVSACVSDPPTSESSPTQSPTATPPSQRVSTITLVQLQQIPVDEGTSAIVLDPRTGIAYAATHAGDIVSVIDATRSTPVVRIVLPDAIEFGTGIGSVALAGDTLFLARTRINRLALLDIKTQLVRQLTPADLGVAAIAAVAGMSEQRVIVVAGETPQPLTTPRTTLLELDPAGQVVRRIALPTADAGLMGNLSAHAVAYDPPTRTLIALLNSSRAEEGRLAFIGPNGEQPSSLRPAPEGASTLLVDDARRRVYVLSEGKQAHLVALDLATGRQLIDTTLGFNVVGRGLDPRSGRLVLTTVDQTNQVLLFDTDRSQVLAMAPIPFDPYVHGVAVDALRARMFVSSRVKPAMVTVFRLP